MLKMIAQIVSWVCLIVLIVPSMLYLAGKMTSLDQVKTIMTVATVLWFVSVPLWMWNSQQ